MKRILIVRPSAIGDVVFASPLSASLRKTYPDAYIAWLAEPHIAGLLAADPNLNAVIPWPKSEWKTLWKQKHFWQLGQAVRQFKRTLRSHHFDTALELQGLLKGGILAWLSGAPERISLGGREASDLLATKTYPRAGLPGKMGSEYLFLAEQLGLNTEDFFPHLHFDSATISATRQLQAEHGLSSKPYVVLAPYTTRPQKHWVNYYWSELIGALLAEGYTPVVLGAQENCSDAQALVSGLAGAVELTGKTTLSEAAALIESAALLVGVDTGLTHMGAAFCTPTVAIFGSTCPYREAGRGNFRVLWSGRSCAPCRRHPTCHGAYSCMFDITPAQVMEAIRVLSVQAPRV